MVTERILITGMNFVVDCLLGKFADKTGTLTDSSGITRLMMLATSNRVSEGNSSRTLFRF